jgi:hypothetical protein
MRRIKQKIPTLANKAGKKAKLTIVVDKNERSRGRKRTMCQVQDEYQENALWKATLSIEMEVK